jgi:hypothetical protein
MYMSEPLLAEARQLGQVIHVGEPMQISFDDEGMFTDDL